MPFYGDLNDYCAETTDHSGARWIVALVAIGVILLGLGLVL
jgi:hypothetical protein